jgi:anti-repressor protein
MRHLNENYSNSNSVAVLSTSTHETSKVEVYEHPLFGKIRMFVQNGKTWFCGTDIATSLGYSNTRDAIVRHCKSHGVVNHDVIDSMGRTQQMKFISEGNVYRLTAKSQMPRADEFENWIFDEIVPSVVNTGSYSVQPQTPQTYLEALKALVSSEEEKQRLAQEKQQLEEKNAKLQPKADFADAAFATDDKVDIGMSAKILKLGFGRNTLFDKLRKAGIFFANRNEPKQRFIDAGYFEMKEKFIERTNHPGFVVTKVLVTQKGLAYINHLFGGKPSDGKLARIV